MIISVDIALISTSFGQFKEIDYQENYCAIDKKGMKTLPIEEKKINGNKIEYRQKYVC
jgi:hypothetical protein